MVATDPGHAVNRTSKQDLLLIVRVIVGRDLSFTYIKNNVLRLLHLVKGAELKLIESNTFMVKFKYPLDPKKTSGGCPWVLDKYALLIEPIDPSKEQEDQRLYVDPYHCQGDAIFTIQPI